MNAAGRHLGILLGSGVAALTALAAGRRVTVDTPWGPPAAPLRRLSQGGLEISVLARHGDEHRLAPHRINYRANLWALREQGVDAILALNTVGGIAAACRAGSLVVPQQLIDYTWGRESTYHDGSVLALRHVDFSRPFDPALSERLRSAAVAAGETPLPSAVYGVAQGPRLETVAEIDRMARDGCDIVGMTAMPEAVLAAELEIPYAMLALVVNPAAGRGPERIEMSAIEAELDAGMARVARVVDRLLQSLAAGSGGAGSQGSM
jgi:5'-methylthioinosine phosphorylase